MGRKTNKQKAQDALSKLSKKELKELLSQYANKDDYDEIESKFSIKCPVCECYGWIRKGKTDNGMSVFKCKECGKKYNIYTGTIMQNTPYSWKVWVSIMEQMLKNQSIKRIRAYLINNGLVQNIDVLTVSAIENKIRAAFAHMEQPVLHGVIQCDEKHFKESQKGIKNPHDVLNSGKRRKGRRRTKPTKYGTMGPEFSTICCAVDSSGHANAKVITIGQAGLCCRCRHHELR